MDSIVHPMPLNRQARYAVRDPVREELETYTYKLLSYCYFAILLSYCYLIAILYLIAIFLFHPPSVHVRYLILFKAPEKM